MLSFVKKSGKFLLKIVAKYFLVNMHPHNLQPEIVSKKKVSSSTMDCHFTRLFHVNVLNHLCTQISRFVQTVSRFVQTVSRFVDSVSRFVHIDAKISYFVHVRLFRRFQFKVH